MKKLLGTALLFLAIVTLTIPSAHATLLGTVPLLPGDTVVPGLTSASPGTLLASLSVPWISSLGTSSGTLVSAVFREAGGTMDFYYQLTNNLTAPNCGTPGKPACDPLSREADTNFMSWLTFVGYRIDGLSLPGGVFVNGTVPPVTADRNSTGSVVGFQYNPPDPAKIQPGQTGYVVVISTNALNFMAGNASIIDGGVTTVASFAPAPTTPPVPEPASFLLFGGGIIALIGRRRRVGVQP